MSFKAIILLKNREAVYLTSSARKTHFTFQKGLYVISEKNIQNKNVDGKIKGAEAIYFEGNPNAVGYADFTDESKKFLNEVVMINALKQTGAGPRFKMGSVLTFLAPLKDPVNLIYLIFVGVIAYGILAGALGWV